MGQTAQLLSTLVTVLSLTLHNPSVKPATDTVTSPELVEITFGVSIREMGNSFSFATCPSQSVNIHISTKKQRRVPA